MNSNKAIQNSCQVFNVVCDGSTLGSLSLTWYNYIDPDKTVELANYFIYHAVFSGAVTCAEIYADGYVDRLSPAGQSLLDLPLLLEKLERLGIRKLMLPGGGAMNWSFLQAGCIDELSIVLAPAGSAEPEAALFDRSRFLPGGESKGFHLIEAKLLEDGAVWLRYQPKLLTFSIHAD